MWHMGVKYAYRLTLGKPEGRRPLGRNYCSERVKLKWFKNRSRMGVSGLVYCGSEWVILASFCEHGKEVCVPHNALNF